MTVRDIATEQLVEGIVLGRTGRLQPAAEWFTHYWGNNCFLEPDYIMDNLDKLRGIPGVLIHGRNDFGGPLHTAWEIAKRWPDAELVIERACGPHLAGRAAAGRSGAQYCAWPFGPITRS